MLSPAASLPNRLLKNARVLASRSDILHFLPRQSIFCEIGIGLGDFTVEILRICDPRKFYAVDKFGLELTPYNQSIALRLKDISQLDYYRTRFKFEINSQQIELCQGASCVQLCLIPDRSVDVFYIDAAHTYEAVRSELEIIKYKINDGGWIIFNDYTMCDYLKNYAFGVIHAANEFMLAEGWEMLFFALQAQMFCDIAIKKLR